MHNEEAESRPLPAKKRSKKLYIIVFLVIAAAASAGAYFYIHRDQSPLPKSIRESVDFPIYYPDTKKLPNGYSLDTNSFKSPEKDVIIYSINYGNDKNILVSLQKRPSDNDIQNFYTNYIPLRNQMQTDLGQAQIGAHSINSKGEPKTVVSLPTNNGSWIILTTPYEINQTELQQVLNSLKE